MSVVHGEPRNLLHEWSRLLIDSLVEVGVRDVVLSPGSRSTPLVLAVVDAVARGGLRCTSIVDERAAGFHALGMAKATGAPTLLLCTSGTAGAHYLPAIIEAGASHAPLVVLTADRPFELQGCAAPQTIDQIKLFGEHARGYFECGMPDASDGALRSLRRLAAQAVATCRGPLPGAVHVNARARKPLEPPPEEQLDDAERALAARVRLLASSPITRHFAPRLAPDERALEELAAAIASSARGVIIAGPAPMQQADARGELLALARATGFPLLAEAASQLRFTAPGARDGVSSSDRYDAFLSVAALRDAAAPDLVIQLGAPPTSSLIDAWLEAHPRCARWVLAPHGWNDPSSRAVALVQAEVAETARALRTRLAGDPGAAANAAWRARFAAAEATTAAVTASVLAEAGFDEATATVIAASREPSRSEPAPVLAIGNSLPIRMIDLLCGGAISEWVVWSQRGANGIDGLISGAAGVARTGRSTRLLLGDVSALHDLGGLGAARDLEVPLVVVVMNNGGGRIFEQLPVAARPDLAGALPLFTTPRTQSFAAAARFFGHRYHAVDEAGAMRRVLAEAQRTPGCTIVEALVPPTSAAERSRELRARVAQALADLPAQLVGPQTEGR